MYVCVYIYIYIYRERKEEEENRREKLERDIFGEKYERRGNYNLDIFSFFFSFF